MSLWVVKPILMCKSSAHNLHLHIPNTVITSIFIRGMLTVVAEWIKVIYTAFVVVATHTMITLVSVSASFTSVSFKYHFTSPF